MSPKMSILAAFLSVAPAVLASKNALSRSNPKPIANATGAPTPVKYNNPESADKTSITPPILSPLIKREIAKPMDMIEPIKGIFLSIPNNGFSAENNLPNIPLPIDFPRVLKGAVTNFKNLLIKFLAPLTNISTPSDIAVEINLPNFPLVINCWTISKGAMIDFTKALAPAINILMPPDIPILDSIFKAPLNGPSVRRPIIKAPTPPNNIKRPPNNNPFFDVSLLSSLPLTILLAFGVIF